MKKPQLDSFFKTSNVVPLDAPEGAVQLGGGDSMPRKKTKKTATRGRKGGTAVAYQQPSPINPLVGAAIGAAVGGVMGAAAAVALSDKETRNKLKVAAGNIRDQAVERIDEMRTKGSHVVDATKEAAKKEMNGSNKDRT